MPCTADIIKVLKRCKLHSCLEDRMFGLSDCNVTVENTPQICSCAPNTPAPGGARLLTHQWGHPGGLGQNGVLPRGHVSQRRAAEPAEGPAEGVDVEPDPGERPAPLPEPPQCQRRPAAPGGECHQGRHIARAGRRPAPQSLLIVIAMSWTAVPELERTDRCHSAPGRSDNLWPRD